MKKSDKTKRMIAFYFSAGLYLILLPVLLSYSLGYKIDFKKIKVYKTGIIYISSNPAGAEIYINGKRYNDLTPAQIEEMKPGAYKIEVKREGFYSWEKDVVVRPNMVTRADRIILFPVIQQTKMLVKRDVSDFVVSDKRYVYYMTKTGLLKSNMDGTGLKRLSFYSNWPSGIIGKRFSRDAGKFLYFNEKTLWAVYLNLDKDITEGGESAQVEEIVTTDEPIVDVFWYSGASYIIVVTEKYINVVELKGGGKRNIASLYKFNARPKRLYYDSDNDSIYFTDIGRDADSMEGTYLYRLDLRQTFFDKFMKLLLKREAEAGNEKD